MDGIHAIASAVPGWRVVYLRRSPPWIREVVPVVVWALVDDWRIEGRSVMPLVLAGPTCLLPPDPGKSHVLLAPGDSLDRVIEEAKEDVLECARAARRAARSKKAREARRAARDAAIAADPTLAPPPKDDSRFTAMARNAARDLKGWNSSRAEGVDVLAYLLARGCEVSPEAEVDAIRLFSRYQSWCAAWQVEPIPRTTFTTTIVGMFAGLKRRGAYATWRGLRLREDVGAMVEPDAEADDAGLRQFVRAYVHYSWDGGSLSERQVLACYRSWCRWNRRRPASRTDVAAAVTKTARRTWDKGADGGRRWEKMQCRCRGRN